MQADTGSERTRTLRTFSAGAGCGFAAGALFVALLVSQYADVAAPDLAEPPANERGTEPTAPGAATSPPTGRSGEGARHDGTVGTSGASRPSADSAGAPSPEPKLSAPPVAELAARQLLIPVDGVSADRLNRSFTEERNGRQHEAMDILAPRNTPVRAVERGRIVRLFHSNAGGLTIYQFDPSERFCYYYAHLERYAAGLVEGQEVARGQVIGYVGVSGNAPDDTPHLHFAIFLLTDAKRWWEGTPLDPYDVLGRRNTG